MQCPFDLLTKTPDDLVKELLIEYAIVKTGDIFPLKGKEKLSDGFIYVHDNWWLWYTDMSGNVHLVSQRTNIDKLFKEKTNNVN